MKYQYVQTSNHALFIDMVYAVENRAASEARMLLLAGEPGTGKSRCVDHFGAERNAIYVEGLPGMTMSYVRDLLAHELGLTGLKGFALQKSINEVMAQRRQTIILDEAQHGLMEKAAVIEYLRRIAEQVGSTLILVCHNSEKHRFAEHRLAHISTRISALVEFKPASLADCALYLRELCEVSVDDAVAGLALSQSRGRYRLLANACRTLEDLAGAKGLKHLTADDVKGVMLCEDAMRSLRKGAK
jgi:type II secretory pathway predicted ATPase ExeA